MYQSSDETCEYESWSHGCGLGGDGSWSWCWYHECELGDGESLSSL